MTHFQRERAAYEAGQETAREQISALAKRIGALEQQASAASRPAANATTRPLQVGDRVRNAAGTDTGVVREAPDAEGDFPVSWLVLDEWLWYNNKTYASSSGVKRPDGYEAVAPEPDFDTQAREAGYVKAEEVAREFESRYPRSLAPNSWAALFVAWLHAQAKGGAK